MDDPGWSWPAWKFGLKRDDLFNSLHDQYNTFTFSLQDPQAFHADVYEIAHDADTREEFHRLLADRRQQRLRELHDSLETLAVEIIANPKLMDSGHWDFALQLFRTKSFDSLVRYFASYLPDGYLSRHDNRPGSTCSSFSDANSVYTTSTTASSVDDASAPISILTDGPAMTHEPYSYEKDECSYQKIEAPLSPPISEPLLGDSDSAASDVESHSYTSSHPPSRSMSFSGSESEAFTFRRTLRRDDTISQSDDCDTGVTSISDYEESQSPLDLVDDHDHLAPDFGCEVEEEDDLLAAQFPEDTFDCLDTIDDTPDSNTPTPRPDAAATCYLQYKSSVARTPMASSPFRRSPSPKAHRVAGRFPLDVRRSPEEGSSKVKKAVADPTRKRPQGRI